MSDSPAKSPASQESPLTICYVCTSNVCRSPMAASIASWILSSNIFSSSLPPIRVISRGITDSYSPWGSSPSSRMLVSSRRLLLPKNPNAHEKISTYQNLHTSSPLTTSLASSPQTLIFLVTSSHITWLSSTLPPSLLTSLTSSSRLPLIDPPHSIPDPYFGTQETYDIVFSHLLYSVPISLIMALKDRGIVGDDELEKVKSYVKEYVDFGTVKISRKLGQEQTTQK